MQFRLNFDDKINPGLIKKISGRANGGSLNKALQIMVIEWNALEDDKIMSSSRQVPANSPPIQVEETDLDIQITDALESMDW